MFHLARSVYDTVFQEDETKILLLGTDGAGKTTLLERLKKINAAETAGATKKKDDAFGALGGLASNIRKETGASGSASTIGSDLPRVQPTVGLNTNTVHIDGRKCILWDVGGQKPLRQLWTNYIGQCHGIVLVVDGTDREKVVESGLILQSLFRMKAMARIPILIAVNKRDLEAESMSLSDIQSALNLVEIAVKDHQREAGAETQDSSAARKAGPDADPMIPDSVRFSSGIGHHVFRMVPMSALAGGPEVKDGMNWIVNYLRANPFHVEEI